MVVQRPARHVARRMTEFNPPTLHEATQRDLLTIAAIAIIATVITDFIHERLAHGGMCLATGALSLMISSMHFEWSVGPRLWESGRPLANLFPGTLFCLP